MKLKIKNFNCEMQNKNSNSGELRNEQTFWNDESTHPDDIKSRTIRYRLTYIGDKLIEKESWHYNGNKESHIMYKDNNRISIKRWYSNGTKESERNNFIDATAYEYYENGQIKNQTCYRNGQKEGKEIHWFENGTKNYETQYKQGREDGKRIVWYLDGTKNYEENYEEGISISRTHK
jgi:antitoxin component YwqK of YwqJK toxin-antitoxin module